MIALPLHLRGLDTSGMQPCGGCRAYVPAGRKQACEHWRPGARPATSPVRLTEQDVREIRASRESQTVLAHRYGVSQSAISFVVTRKTWKDVE